MDIAGMQDARRGALYLWQGVEVESGLASLVMGGLLSSASGIAGVKEIDLHTPDLAADIAGDAIGSDSGDSQNLLTRIKTWAQNFVNAIWDKLKSTFTDIGEFGGMLKNIGLFVASQVFSKAAPIIGGVAGLVTGLWKFTTVFAEKVSNWKAKGSFKLNTGHPKTLVKGIEKGLTRGMLEGLYELAKSALSVGLNAASLGAASIVDAIAAVAEAAVKIIWRVAEVKALQKFTRQAREYWTGSTPGQGIHMDQMKFDNWIRPMTQKVPVVAAVTLGSGIAGDKMRFLQMYTGEGNIISASDFKAGVKYLDQMKRAGSRLIERSDIEYGSSDPLIKGLLKLAKSHQEVYTQKKGFFSKLFRTTDKIMRA